jgi:isoleucyl-tRNA synthetase
VDQELMADMELAIRVAGQGRAARATAGIKLRQPLAHARALVTAGEQQRLSRLADILLDELNVKQMEYVQSAQQLVTHEVHLRPELLGPKYGPLFPGLREAVEAMDSETLARQLQAGSPMCIDVDGQEITLLPEETEVRIHAQDGYALSEDRGLLVAVDTVLTPQLQFEGHARDIVRRIQSMRKEADFDIDDRIVTYFQADGILAEVLSDPEQSAYVCAETLSSRLVQGPAPAGAHGQSFSLEGEQISLSVQRSDESTPNCRDAAPSG